MIKQVHERISVSIKGKVFKLVYDADHSELSACQRCALMGDVCKGSRDMSLLCLCATIVEEPETFFVEYKPEFSPEGINEQEILVTALTEYKKEMIEIGNSARASKVMEMIDRI